MNGIIAFFDGKKTYIAGLAGAAYGVLIATGVTPDKTSVWLAIASIGVIGVRSAISKLVVASGVNSVWLTEASDVVQSVETAIGQSHTAPATLGNAPITK